MSSAMLPKEVLMLENMSAENNYDKTTNISKNMKQQKHCTKNYHLQKHNPLQFQMAHSSLLLIKCGLLN